MLPVVLFFFFSFNKSWNTSSTYKCRCGKEGTLKIIFQWDRSKIKKRKRKSKRKSFPTEFGRVYIYIGSKWHDFSIITERVTVRDYKLIVDPGCVKALVTGQNITILIVVENLCLRRALRLCTCWSISRPLLHLELRGL